MASASRQITVATRFIQGTPCPAILIFYSSSSVHKAWSGVWAVVVVVGVIGVLFRHVRTYLLCSSRTWQPGASVESPIYMPCHAMPCYASAGNFLSSVGTSRVDTLLLFDDVARDPRSGFLGRQFT